MSEPSGPEDLWHCAYDCGGEMVYALDGRPDVPGQWYMTLRCPNCETVDEGIFTQTQADNLDGEFMRASAQLLDSLKEIVKTDTIVLPEDFDKVN